MLASGRPFEFLHDLQENEQAFDLIFAENGAVLYNPRTDELQLPFGKVLDMLTRPGVPLWKGIAIDGTRMPYDDAVLTFHFQRGDYSRWIRDVLHDETLARWVDRLQAADLSGEALRLALLDTLEQRHRLLERLI